MKAKHAVVFFGFMLAFPWTAFTQSLVTIVPFGSTWRYLDNGSNQGTNWIAPGFNDAGWSSGPGQLGYGDGDEATVVSFGTSSANKYITTYFRRSFLVADSGSISALEVHLVRDDGARVFLNGVEVWRDNLPAGNISYLTEALSPLGESLESLVLTNWIDPSLLVAGSNVLAVEIHQVNPTSSDISFDLELAGVAGSGPPMILAQPQSQTVAVGSTVNFTVPVEGAPPLFYQWQFNGEDLAGANRATLVLANVNFQDAGSYQARISNSLGSVVSVPATLTVYQALTLGLALDAPDLEWTTGGDADWVPQTRVTYDGQDAAESGEITHGENTWIETTVLGPGTLRFRWRVSSESGFDYLEFFLNGAMQDRISGSVGWERREYSLNAGSQVLRWRYRKDGSVNSGEDKGWVDQVEVPPQSGPPTILVEPDDQVTMLGGAAVYSVLASGTRPLAYQWDFNGLAMTGATNETLVLTGVTREQAGRYRVSVSNALGTTTSRKALLSIVEAEGDSFRIASLTTNNAQTIEHEPLTGNDWGGIAASGTHVFYTGADSTARFRLNNLFDSERLDRRYDALVSDLRTGALYSLGNGTNLIGYGGGVVNTLLELDSVTGVPTGAQVHLSVPVPMNAPGPSGSFGLFSGFGRIVLHNGERVFDMALPSGEVRELGAMEVPAHQNCSSWAYWGVAEYFNGSVHLVFVESSLRIVRVRVPDGAKSTVASFLAQPGLGDMCGFTISLAQRRWYFHHESSSVFQTGGNETLGFADAELDFTQPSSPPVFAVEPPDRYGLLGLELGLESVVFGAEPLSYQWYFDGTPISGAESPVLRIDAASTNQSGAYQLVVDNAFGTATSRVARVVIHEARGRAGYFLDNLNPILSGDFETPLIQARFIPVRITDMAAFDLGTLSVLLLEEQGNQVSLELVSRLPDIQDWVDQGGKVIVSDPIFNFSEPSSDPLVVGSPRTQLQSNPSGDIDFTQPATNPLADGPYGTLQNGSLDSSEFVHGGYALGQTLPVGSRLLLSDGPNVGRVIGFSYGLGGGFVYFSTVWMGLALSDLSTSLESFRAVFVPNLIDYMAGLAPSGPVQIGAPPQNQIALETTTARFSAVASGEGPLQFEWFFNGQAIPGTAGSLLTLTNVSTNAAGNYHVVVSNPLGSVTSTVARLTVLPVGLPFQITSLSTNGVEVVDSLALAGDDRGGIAAGAERFLYTGDSGTASFSLDDLPVGFRAPQTFVGLVSDLDAERIYTLANGDSPLSSPGTVTALLEVDETTGALTGNRINLSQPITLYGSSSSGDVGIFAGFGRVVIHNGMRVYHISVPSGYVFDLGPMDIPEHEFSESYGYWGVAEFFGGRFYLVYPRDPQTIVRTRVPDGLTMPLATFTSLGNMDALTVSVRRGRWYFHHESSSQFSGFSETVGSAEGAFEVVLPLSPPVIRTQPASQVAFAGSEVTLRVGVTGTRPLFFQWHFNGLEIPQATNASYVIPEANFAHAGTYQVAISNALGSSNSTPALLEVLAEPNRFQIVNLGTSNVRAIDHYDITSFDYYSGPLAASSSHVYYTGYAGTGRFSVGDLSGGTRLSERYDALFSDLATETLYTLANGNTPLARGGGTITALIQIDSPTGALTDNRVTLTTPITVTGSTYFGNVGIFSGANFVLIHTGSRVYAVQIDSGRVFDLGPMPSLSGQRCYTWAFWGIAEYFDGAFHLAYIGYDQILRTRVPDGQAILLADFTNLGTMCSFSILPTRNRWYFHYEGSGQFGSFDELLGYADAQFRFDRGPVFSPIGTKIFWEDLPTFPPTVTNIAFTVVDDSTPGSNLVFSVGSTNHAVIPPENIFLSGSGTNFILSVLPLPNAFGETVITLQATDPEGNVGSVEFGISVRPINDAPSFTLATNLLVVGDTAGLQSHLNWANDISPGPPNESDQTVTFQVSNNASNLFAAQPSLSPEGTLTFTPIPGRFGEAMVTVLLQDSGGRGFGGRDASPAQTFTIRIASANTPPAAQSVAFNALEDQPFAGTVSGSDLDGDPLTFHLLDAPALGLVVLNTNSGAFTYTPPAHYHGTVHFTFTAHDGKVFSLPGTVTLDIQPVNDAPVAQAQSVQAEEDTEVIITLSGSDVDGDTLTYQIVDPPGHGMLTGRADPADWSYQPAADYSGPDQFRFRVSDGTLESEVAVVSITVEAVNDAPVAVVRVEPWDVVWPGQTRQLIIAPYADWTWVILDGSQSSDPEGDALEYLWTEEGTPLPLAVGSVVTNLFMVGPHRVVLQVDDGQDIGTAAAEFEVIPPALALEEIILWIQEGGLPQNRKQPLIVSLRAALESFERGNLGSGLNQLGAAKKKLSAQVARQNPDLAGSIEQALDTVIEAVVNRSEPVEDKR